MNSRKFQILTLLTIVALLACGQAIAAEHHYTIKVIPRQHDNMGAAAPVAVTPNLYALTAAFAASPYVASASPTNTDGSELWPCFGSYSSASGTSSENVDCPTIGDPKQGFPAGGVILGGPQYVWSLADCNATSTSANFCGQTETFYEDDSNDTTDDLLYIIEATQGTSVIADSGTIDFGPNTFGGLTPPADVVIYGDQNFGTLGETGENNGNCDASFNYPLLSGANPGETYGIAANKTCVAAVSGPVTITATTELATPAYTKSTSKTTCAPVGGPPCYTVKYTSVHKISQKILINLQ